jgi:predicted metal-binding membrane protein
MTAATWVPMMAAMMLPSALPAVFWRAHDGVAAAASFTGSYLAVWAAVALAVYSLGEPHGDFVAGALVVAAGLYELTPVKRRCRALCRSKVRSGFEYGAYCVGSSIGLMAVLAALGLMSMALMAVVAGVVLAQKLLPPTTEIDVPLAVAILVLGIAIAID